jgi:hypothetical protein
MIAKTAHSRRHWLEPPSWWKRWKPLRILALGVIGFSVLSTSWTIKKYVLVPEPHPETAYYTSIAPQTVPLGDFHSYDNLQSSEAALTASGYTFTAKALHTPFSELYPRHDIDTLTVESYKHLDNEGKLNLEFFNDRLYEVEFIPKDPDSYAHALHQELPDLKSNRIGDALLISGNLRISSNVDLVRNSVGQTLGAHPFAIWQDLRLTRQRDQWDRDFGETPVKAY